MMLGSKGLLTLVSYKFCYKTVDIFNKTIKIGSEGSLK